MLFAGALITKFHNFCLSFPDIIFPQSPVAFHMQLYRMQGFGVCVPEGTTEMPIKHLK